MKKILLFPLFILIQLNLSAQTIRYSDSCLSISPNVKGYIAGFQDSTIKKNEISEGFDLKLTDTTYSIIGYTVMFYSGDQLVELPSKGISINPPEGRFENFLKNINDKSILSFLSIIVSKNQMCYKIPPFHYYVLD